MAKIAAEKEAAERAAWEAGESAELDENGNPAVEYVGFRLVSKLGWI